MKTSIIKKTAGLALASALLLGLCSGPVSAASSPTAPQPIVAAATNATDKTPRQLNVHMGDDPSTQVNVTYTTCLLYTSAKWMEVVANDFETF